jgi:hypothetical protein
VVLILSCCSAGEGVAQFRFTVQAPIDLSVGTESGAHPFVLADLNKDNRPDIVSVEAEEAGGRVAVLLNDGNGAFGVPQFFGNTDFFDLAKAVQVGDLGSSFTSETSGRPDGNVDIVVAGDDTLTILYGNGSGGFDFPEEPIDVESIEIVAIALGNFDGQGTNDDVACLDPDGEIFFLCSPNEGIYAECLTPSIDVVETSPDIVEGVDIATGDFNGDGNTDVVALFSGPESGENLVFQAVGVGNGSFTVGRTGPADIGASAMKVGFIDTDTLADVAVVESQGDTFEDNLTILRGSANGTFRRSKAFLEVGATGLALSDFDQDGCLDIVGVSPEGSTAPIAMGRCDGTFSEQLDVGPPTGDSISVEAADLTGDMLPDFVTLNEAGNQLRVVINRGPGPTDTPAPPTAVPTSTPTPTATGIAPPQLDFCDLEIPTVTPRVVSPVAIVQGRFNTDANVDIAILDGSNPDGPSFSDDDDGFSYVIVFLGDPAQLGLNVTCPIQQFVGTQVYQLTGEFRSLALGDVDKNGTLDLIASGPSGVQVLLGSRVGTFAEGQPADLIVTPTPTPTGAIPVTTPTREAVAVADFNRDECDDLATVDGRTLLVLTSQCDGRTFVESQRFDIPGATLVLPVDLNGDTYKDLAVASGNTITPLIRDPEAGTFRATTRRSFPLAGGSATSMVAAPIAPGSNREQIFVTVDATGFVALRLSTSGEEGLTQSAAVSTVNERPIAIGLGPFVGSDLLDDVVVGSEFEDLLFFPGNTDGTFGNSLSTSDVDEEPTALVVGYFDADNLPDVAVTRSGVLRLFLSGRVPPTPTPTETRTAGPTNSPTETTTPGPTLTATSTPRFTREPTGTPKDGTFSLSSCGIAPPRESDGHSSLLLLLGAAWIWFVRRRQRNA